MDAYVSYDGGQNGKEEKRSSTGASSNAQQETDARAAERDRHEGSTDAVGCVYFFETEDGQFVKIGYSANVGRRMGQIGTLVPMRMIGYFPGSRETESWLHRKFAGQWHRGEWFKSSPELREFVRIMGLLTMPPEPAELSVVKPNDGIPCSAAVALGKRGAVARMKKLTAEQRSAIARKAGLAGGRGRKKEE